ncbi:hypothetical protein ACHQM5_020864 [Ranunculus cassubicifolius]
MQMDIAAIGAVYRNEEEVKMVSWKKLGKETIFYAECEAIITCVEMALGYQWLRLWVETDSLGAVHSRRQNKAPWRLKGRWERCLAKVSYLLLSHNWREANFSADCVAKHAILISDIDLQVVFGRPS